MVRIMLYSEKMFNEAVKTAILELDPSVLNLAKETFPLIKEEYIVGCDVNFTSDCNLFWEMLNSVKDYNYNTVTMSTKGGAFEVEDKNYKFDFDVDEVCMVSITHINHTSVPASPIPPITNSNPVTPNTLAGNFNRFTNLQGYIAFVPDEHKTILVYIPQTE